MRHRHVVTTAVATLVVVAGCAATGGDATGGAATGDATAADATAGDATAGDATGGDATGGDATGGGTDLRLPAGATGPPEELWTTTLDGEVLRSAVVVDDVLHLLVAPGGPGRRALRTFDLDTGTELSRTELRDGITRAVLSTPDGHVLLPRVMGGSNGPLVGLDADAEVAWSVEYPRTRDVVELPSGRLLLEHAPEDGIPRQVFLAAEDGDVLGEEAGYVLDIRGDRVLLQRSMAGIDVVTSAGEAVWGNDDTVVWSAALGDGVVHVLPESGDELRTVDLSSGDELWSTAVPAPGHVGTVGGLVVVTSGAGGGVSGDPFVGGEPPATAFVVLDGDGDLVWEGAGEPIPRMNDGTPQLVVAQGAELHLFDAASGERLANGAAPASVVGASDEWVLSWDDGDIVATGWDDLSERWRLAVEAGARPVVLDGTLLVVTERDDGMHVSVHR